MEPFPKCDVRSDTYLWAISQASAARLGQGDNHWQRAERFHDCSDLLFAIAHHYQFYAALYARQNKQTQAQDCLAKANNLQRLAARSHASELREWQLAHQAKRAAQQSQNYIQRGFLRMITVYCIGCFGAITLGVSLLLQAR